MAKRDKDGKFIADTGNSRIPRSFKKLMLKLNQKLKLKKLKSNVNPIGKNKTPIEHKPKEENPHKLAIKNYLENRQIEKAIRAEEIEQSYINRQQKKEKTRLKNIA